MDPLAGATASVLSGAAAGFFAFALGGLVAGLLAGGNGGLNGLASTLLGGLLAYVVLLVVGVALLATAQPPSVTVGVLSHGGEGAPGFSARGMAGILVLSAVSNLVPFLGGYLGGELGGWLRGRRRGRRSG